LTGIYGFLVGQVNQFLGFVRESDYSFVVFWGAAIVFFLARFINLHNANTQGFWVEVSSQVVCGALLNV
jgi:hypothetical protein